MLKPLSEQLLARLVVLLCFVAFVSQAVPTPVSAHGGEDHGDEKPTTETTAAGSVVRTTRLGEFELTLKHVPIAPDTPAHATLFVTNYTSNEPVASGEIQIAIDGQDVPTANATVARSTALGIYSIDLPALREGEYTIRVTVTDGGKASSATFSGIQVQTAAAVGQATSWPQILLTGGFLFVGIALFAALVFLSVKVARRRPITEEAVTA
ncbi:MAG TPA: hypothetical protein PKD26_10645 [Pyrinomonadaceae bacterium]|mgnify:FL=1|nr:hypothetical protein [Pyrinomonadaceae bacterium]